MIKQGLPAIHPGEFLAEILQELGRSARFPRVIGVSPIRVSHVVNRTAPGDSGIGAAVRACVGAVAAVLAQFAGKL